ncbi:MAG: phytoene desaturase family protein [Myxococcota bacterium]
MAEPRHAAVIGAGVGGLCAAIALAAHGLRVTVVEAASEPGGKAGTALLDGVEVDTGPSVLTLPDVFDGVLRLAGTTLADEIALLRPEPAFRYRWPDGTVLDVHVALEETLASVRAALGAEAEAELAAYLRYVGGIWEVAAPRFVRGEAPGPAAMLSWSALRDVARIDPLRTMGGAIRARVREPHLRDLLLRYATYAGSDPRRAPATLGCIAHVELALGGFGVEGGIAALVRALVRAADRLGVALRLGEPVRRVVVAGGRAVGLETGAGRLDADLVVSNAEVAHLRTALCGKPPGKPATSTSGWTGIVRAAAQPGRAAHTVLFPVDYAREFVDLFDHARVPLDPTVYVCAQRACHRRAGWPGEEPLFVMVNAPPGDAAPDADCSEVVLARLRAAGLAGDEARIVWSRTPGELAARFPGSGGALYGPAHDGPLGALTRPGNRVRGIAGLYVASGSAHPGGGLPLAALSGRAAVRAALQDAGISAEGWVR